MRQEKGLTQKETSEKIGISQPSYFAIESGKSNPSISTAKSLGLLFDFDWTHFFEDVEAKIS